MLMIFFVMLISKNLHKKSREVSIKTRSTPASASFIDQVTKHTTVKWAIIIISDLAFLAFYFLITYNNNNLKTYIAHAS